MKHDLKILETKTNTKICMRNFALYNQKFYKAYHTKFKLKYFYLNNLYFEILLIVFFFYRITLLHD